jgi:drug/metabolite transporter (DMT)-like permease
MLLGILLFSANDVMGKWLVASYGVGQVLLVRSAAALVVLVPAVRVPGWRSLVVLDRPGLQALRVLLSTLEVALFYWAVVYLPLVDTMTLYLAAPAEVVLLSALLLGEKVERARWAAVGAGFAGVVITLAPSGETLTSPALIAVAGSLCFAGLVITTRFLRETTGVALVTWQTGGALVLGALLAPFDWAPITSRDLGLVMLLGVVAMLAHACVTHAIRLAPASVVAPYQYTFIVWAILFGWLVFGDVPGPRTVVGAGVIVAAGLVLLWQDRRRAG